MMVIVYLSFILFCTVCASLPFGIVVTRMHCSLGKKDPLGLSLESRFESLLSLHGGKKRKPSYNKVRGLHTRGRRNTLTSIQSSFNNVPQVTRMYLILIIMTTIIHCVGLPAPVIFSLDKNRLWELWRPFTSLAYFGPPSMSMANSVYFLVRYGQGLESEVGSIIHAWYLLIQTLIISLLGIILGLPFGAQAMIASIIYTSSNLHPMEKM